MQVLLLDTLWDVGGVMLNNTRENSMTYLGALKSAHAYLHGGGSSTIYTGHEFVPVYDRGTEA